MPIELNALECARFNITSAKLIEPHASLVDVNAAAVAQGVDMITARLPFDDLARVHVLEADGYRLMDTLVYYSCSLTDGIKPVVQLEGISLRLSEPEDAITCAKIAARSFQGYLGHYHADPRLEDAAADAAYVEWAENAVRYAGDLPAILVEVAGIVAGFMTLRENTREEIEIVLNAVHPDSAGNGLYGLMLSEALHLAQERGASRLIVSTQINNIAVQRAWTRNGLRLDHGYYTFHKWYF